MKAEHNLRWPIGQYMPYSSVSSITHRCFMRILLIIMILNKGLEGFDIENS